MMYIVEANQNGAPLEEKWMNLWLNFSHHYDGKNLYLFDSNEEYNNWMAENYGMPMPKAPIWDIPSNATIVEHKEFGIPVDEKWLKYPRFFRGDVLFVFNTQEEFDKYISDRTDYTDLG